MERQKEYTYHSIDLKPIKIASDFVDEILEFIHKLMQA